MGEVVDIEEAMPHLCIVGESGKPHIVPVKCVLDMASGKLSLINKGQELVDEDLIRGIIKEFLSLNGIDV